MVLIILLCILFIYLFIHQRFYSIEGKKPKNPLKKVTKPIEKAANKVGDVAEDAADAAKNAAEAAAKEIEDKANAVGRGFKGLLKLKFVRFVKQLFRPEFLKDFKVENQ
jgi:hypothetical protein